MKVLSLGCGCQVKFNIDRLFKKEETHFFDWLITDFQSVLYILKNINDKEVISESKFTDKDVFLMKKTWTDCHKIEHLNFKMISTHDLLKTTNYIDNMKEFILKYERRLNRLKNLIIGNENVHMIHCIDHQFMDGYIPTESDIYYYKRYLHEINILHKCFLHVVIPPKYNNLDLNCLIQERIYVYYLHDTGKVCGQWANTNYNWNIVFDNITNIG
jgi:hypothetical protein